MVHDPFLLDELGGQPGQSTLRLGLALEVHLHGHLSRLLDDILLASSVRNLSLRSLGIEELQDELVPCEETTPDSRPILRFCNKRGAMTHLASLGHGHAQKGSLARPRAGVVVGLGELLEGLHGGRGPERAGVAFAVVVVGVLVLLDGICLTRALSAVTGH